MSAPTMTQSFDYFFFPNSNIDFDSDDEISWPLPPPPPPPWFNRTTSASMISGFVDFSELLVLETDNDFSNLPPPPPPPPPPSPPPLPIANLTRRVHRLPPPPHPTPSRTSYHPLPLPMPVTHSNGRSHIHTLLPPPPPPPPPSDHLSSDWNYFFQDQDPIYPVQLPIKVQKEEKVELLPDKKMTEELMGSDCLACAICIDNFELDQVVKQMPCNHIYHSSCILRWLETQNTCPVCRYKLPSYY